MYLKDFWKNTFKKVSFTEYIAWLSVEIFE